MTDVITSPGSPAAPPEQGPAAGEVVRKRPDVQGLRAIAVLAVVAVHVGIGSLTGGFVGVDVFFAISGFLITQQLLRQVRTEGRVGLLGFYARRAKRILPAATLVLVATVVFAALELGFVRTKVIALDALWSAAFAANLRFSALQTDYFSAALPPSPLQHFWSLAVEEQFYLVWPLVILVCLWLMKHHRRTQKQLAELGARTGRPADSRRWLIIALSVLIAASLVTSAWLTRNDPEGAYFSPFTRAWELGLGCLAAIAFRDDGSQNATARWRAQVLAAFGMFFIVCACLQFNDATPFPGTPALVPVLGSVFILVAGTLWHGPTVVSRILGVRPLQILGNWSYSLYLWHFPVLILAELKLGRDLRWWEQVLLVALALALSGLSYHFVEEPFRRGRIGRPTLWKGAVPVVLYPLSLALVAVTCFGANTFATAIARDGYQPAISLAEGSPTASSSPSASSSSSASASARPSSVAEPAPKPAPDPMPALLRASVIAAEKNRPIPTNLHPGLTAASKDVETVGECNYYGGIRKLCPRGDATATRTIVVIGDSHGRHWIPAVEKIAQRAHYKTYYLVLPQCPIALLTPDQLSSTEPFTACSTFHDWMLKQVKALHPDVLLISSRPLRAAYHDARGRHSDPDDVSRAVYASYQRLLSIVKPAAKRTVWLRDVPAIDVDPSDCLSTNKTLKPCLFQPPESQVAGADLQMKAAKAARVETLNLDDLFCYAHACATVVGDMLTHRDTHHITATYSAALGRTLGERLHLW